MTVPPTLWSGLHYRPLQLAYNKDETLVLISGEAFITNEKGEERRLGPGDIVFSPAGTSSTWRVPRYIKKVAFLRHTMPRPLGSGVLAWNLLLRIVRLRSGSLLMLTSLLSPASIWRFSRKSCT